MEMQVQTAPPKKHRFVSADITGKKYGRLTALHPTKKRDAKGYVIWHCLCDCGTEADVSYNDLLYTQVQSCGCQKREHNKKLGTYLTHMGGTSLEMLKSKKVPTNNTTGVKGVYLIRGKYLAKIVFQKKQYTLGTYEKFEEAAEARREAEKLLFDGSAEFYERWKTKAEADPKWAESNPIQIKVEKLPSGVIDVSFLPAV